MNQRCSHVLRHVHLALAALIVVASSPCHAAANALAVLAERPELSIFYRLVKMGGLQDALRHGAYTVFAPTDAAFESLTADELDGLARQPQLLKALLTYHVLAGRATTDAVHGSNLPVTLGGQRLSVAKSGDHMTADDALVIAPDLEAGDSVVHVIDRVLQPRHK